MAKSWPKRGASLAPVIAPKATPLPAPAPQEPDPDPFVEDADPPLPPPSEQSVPRGTLADDELDEAPPLPEEGTEPRAPITDPVTGQQLSRKRYASVEKAAQWERGKTATGRNQGKVPDHIRDRIRLHYHEVPSQERLAHIFGVSVGTIRKILKEKGGKVPPPEMRPRGSRPVLTMEEAVGVVMEPAWPKGRSRTELARTLQVSRSLIAKIRADPGYVSRLYGAEHVEKAKERWLEEHGDG